MGCWANLARTAPFEVDMEGSQLFMGVCKFGQVNLTRDGAEAFAWLGLYDAPISS